MAAARFVNKIIKHPGSWILGSLIAIGIASAAPAAAPALVILAFLGTAIAAPVALGFQAYKFWGRANKKMFGEFVNKHPWQFAAVLLAVGLLITALVLTIGFFTGGGAFLVAGGAVAAIGGGSFAFMGPFLAGLAAPFATAAATWGISLSLAALTGLCMVLGALNLPNTLKRFLSWLDSFKYDGAMVEQGSDKINWANKAAAKTEVKNVIDKIGYYPTVFQGMGASIANGLSSPHENVLQAAEEAEESNSKSNRV